MSQLPETRKSSNRFVSPNHRMYQEQSLSRPGTRTVSVQPCEIHSSVEQGFSNKVGFASKSFKESVHAQQYMTTVFRPQRSSSC